MGVFWAVAGCLSLFVPHLASAQSGVMYAWSGLPYTGELVALIVLALLSMRFELPDVLRARLPKVALGATMSLLVFEMVAAVFGAFAAHFLPLAFAEEALHVAAVWACLACASRRADVHKCQGGRVGLLSALFFLGGMFWYLSVSAMRAGNPWAMRLELLMWAASLLWALPIVCAAHVCHLDRRAFWSLAAAPFTGAFVANRACNLALRLGVKALLFPKGWPLLIVGPALSFVAFALLIAFSAKDSEDVSEPSSQTDKESQDSALPLHLIPGYQLLSARERQILLRTLEGATSSEVADELDVAATTVRTYRARAYEKLGVSSPDEVLEALRLAIEKPVPMPVEPVENMSPAVRTLAERMAPPVACLAVGSLAAATAFATWALPFASARLVATVALFAAALVTGIVGRGLRRTDTEPRYAVLSVMAGAASALALASVVAGPVAFALRRTVFAAAVVTLCVWAAYRARPFDEGAAIRALAFFGLIGVALVPQGSNVQAILRSLMPLPLCCALLIAVGVLLRAALKDHLAQLASVVLMGDARILAYLEGRGIPTLQARVALLTARDYPLGGIAATLSMTASAVTQSRMRTYRDLGVANKQELIALLERDAGLVGKGRG